MLVPIVIFVVLLVCSAVVLYFVVLRKKKATISSGTGTTASSSGTGTATSSSETGTGTGTVASSGTGTGTATGSGTPTPMPIVSCAASAPFLVTSVGQSSSADCPTGFRGLQTALCRADGTFAAADRSGCVAYGPVDNLSANATIAQAGVYSLRRVSSLYTGPILDLRRATDSATISIFADKDAVYTLQNGSPLSSWLATGTIAYVTKWYDQSPNAKHAVQTDATIQPIFDPVKKFIDFKPNRWFKLPDSTVPDGNKNYTVVVKHNTIANTKGCYLGSGTFHSNNSCNTFRRNGSGYLNYWWNFDAGTNGYADGNVVTYTYDGAARRGYLNGALSSTSASANRAAGTGNNTIGSNVISEHLNGELYYLWVFSSALTDADRLIVEGSG